MGRRLNLIVNYKNCLGFWHIAVETMAVSLKNNFITYEEFASWIAELYMRQGCTEVECIEFLCGNITKSAIKGLCESDAKFITDQIRKSVGRRWTFTKEEKEGGD